MLAVKGPWPPVKWATWPVKEAPSVALQVSEITTRGGPTVKVKCWGVGEVSPSEAWIVKGQLPAVPGPGVPARVAPEFPWSVRVTPLGSAPVSDQTMVPEQVVVPVTWKVPASPSMKVVELAEVMTTAHPTSIVNAWTALGRTPLA